MAGQKEANEQGYAQQSIAAQAGRGERGQNDALISLESGDCPSLGLLWRGEEADRAKGDGTVRIWEARAAQLVAVHVGHQGAVLSVRWAPNGSGGLASASEDGQAKIWAVPGAP
ncbi:unnamed protein product [Durusdinium trenchii]|uniref:TAF5-like RNA polymerase II p300/CBP-associated factor-associated factor 65 kDa subunit 5L (TAF5L) (PCAF-associated factor 65 beta) (PAF65-beta) n=2 Tax=Durusdinium trenchii TaxID=1381693 RepID=A0ABP0IQ32_9DINO